MTSFFPRFICLLIFFFFLNRLELEDIEMKHNSSLKQLMREFNTQMALKEKELEGSVKETIGKRSILQKYCLLLMLPW